MSNLINKMITHNFCINSIEEVPEDKTVLKFKAIVMHFNKSHNGWAVSKTTAEKYKHTLLHKHIVTRYYNEDENGGIDALGDHEPDSTKLRGTNGDVLIPCTNTHSIGTITNVYIAPLNDGSNEDVLWCEGILLAWDNINECSLLLEWSENNIPILVSVEWYYTQNMIDNDDVEWIVDPTFSALTILNSEQRGNKDIVYGNYDNAHIELMLNSEHYKQFNNAIIKDLNLNNNGKGEIMENKFLQALNDVSFGDIRDKIYTALAKVMVADEYNSLWISMWDIYDTYFVYETYDGEKWVRYKIDYTKAEDDTITVNYESKKKVERQDVYVEVSESQSAVNEVSGKLEVAETKLNELEIVLEKANESLELANGEIETLKSDNEKLKEFEIKLNKIDYEEKLNAANEQYKIEFEEFNGLEKFNSDEVQNLIKDTLDAEKQVNAVIELQKVLLSCAKNNKPAQQSMNSKSNSLGLEPASNFGNLGAKSSNKMLDDYGLNLED